MNTWRRLYPRLYAAFGGRCPKIDPGADAVTLPPPVLPFLAADNSHRPGAGSLGRGWKTVNCRIGTVTFYGKQSRWERTNLRRHAAD